MTDIIIVASHSPMAVHIVEPRPHTDKPGEAPPPKSAVLNGSRHARARNGVGLTHGVDAGLFHAWLDEQKRLKSPLAGLVYEVSAEDAKKPAATSFGFEPGLKTLGDSEGKAGEGSAVTHDAPVSSTEMAATSDTPNDDTPRGDPDVVPTSRRQKPATAQVDPAQNGGAQAAQS